MNIKKPHRIILSKKYPDRYFDWDTDKEFPCTEINEHFRWYKHEYDKNENIIYYEDSYGYWEKIEYNNNGIVIYYENSWGHIKDNTTQQIN